MDVNQKTRTGAKLLGTGALAAAISLFAAILWAPAASAKPALVAVSSESACLANQNINYLAWLFPPEDLHPNPDLATRRSPMVVTCIPSP